MPNYDPEWSISSVLDHLAEVSNTVAILTLCLDQIDENPPDLLPRLTWLIRAIRCELELVVDDGSYNVRQLRDYLHRGKLLDDDQGDDTSIAE